jgi:catalase
LPYLPWLRASKHYQRYKGADFLWKTGHFDRACMPERIAHARGTEADSVFDVYGAVG